MTDPVSFGKLVESKRMGMEMSVRELARRVGVDPAYIGKIEKENTINPSFPIVMRISKELGIPMKSLIESFNLHDWVGYIDVSIKDKVRGEDKTEILDITNDVIDLTNDVELDFDKLMNVMKTIYHLHEKNYDNNSFYYVITVIDSTWIRSLQTKIINEKLLKLYHSAFMTTPEKSMIIHGMLLQYYDCSECFVEEYTLSSLLEKCKSDDEDGICDPELEDYLEKILNSQNSN